MESKRTQIFKKICEQFMVHLQNSVFRGDITQSQLMKLSGLIKKEVKSNESVYIWVIKDSQIYNELKFGRSENIDDNIL